MRLLIVLVAVAAMTGTARSEPAAPATKAAAAPFKLTQEMQLKGGEKVVSEFHFAGEHVLMLNDADEGALYNSAARTVYIERHDRMIEERFIQAWLNGWRVGANARQLLLDPKQEPFIRSLLWPKLEVSEEDGKLYIRTRAAHFEITPMKEVDPTMASLYADLYKLDAYRNAFETRSGSGAFIAAAVADVLREREVIPQTMKITTFTPKGSATANAILRRKPMTEDEVAVLQEVAKQLDRAPETPAPAEPEEPETPEAEASKK